MAASNGMETRYTLCYAFVSLKLVQPLLAYRHNRLSISTHTELLCGRQTRHLASVCGSQLLRIPNAERCMESRKRRQLLHGHEVRLPSLIACLRYCLARNRVPSSQTEVNFAGKIVCWGIHQEKHYSGAGCGYTPQKGRI